MYKKVKSFEGHVVELEASKIGNDFNISIYGGGRPHIGEAAVATYNRQAQDATVVGLSASTSTSTSAFGDSQNQPEGIAHRAAKHLALALKATVCVTCGIQCEESATEEARILCNLVEELLDNIKLEFAS